MAYLMVDMMLHYKVHLLVDFMLLTLKAVEDAQQGDKKDGLDVLPDGALN